MEKFVSITSTVIPLPLADVDTDMIIPAQYLTSVSREGFGENLFRRLRDKDPNFPLNRPLYRGAAILAAGDNFGCGSSREHAVWALLGAGIRVVLSTSFADIFSGNAAKNGLVLIALKKEDLDEIISAADGTSEVSVDLEQQIVTTAEGRKIHFPFDSFRKHCILNGLDDLDYLLAKQEEINKFFAASSERRFFTSLKVNNS